MSSSASERSRGRGRTKLGKRSRGRSSNSDGVASELDELIEISRAIGADPDLVQGGGGNTSVKSATGERMWVKASGTALADMDRDRGWAELDRALVDGILDDPALPDLPSDRREIVVLRRLENTVVAPLGARPTVEANLHALLGRVVIHTHPVGFDAVLCSRGGRDAALAALGDLGAATLVVPYVDPGFLLAREVRSRVDAFEKKNGRRPAIVLLENHGVFVAAGDVASCLELAERVARIGAGVSGLDRVNSPELDWVIAAEAHGASAGDAQRNGGSALSSHDIEVAVRGALIRGGAAPVVVRADTSPLARDFVADSDSISVARRGAFTPDQIVYCRARPLVLPRSEKSFAAAVTAYREKHGADPRVVILPSRAVLYAAPSLPELRTVREVWRSAMATIRAARGLGGARLLDANATRFIETWEVERFRAALAARTRGKLAGRVAVVTGAGSGLGRGIALGVADAGATVIGVDVDLGALEETASSRSAGKFLPVRCDVTDETSVAAAFRTVLASVGGLDYLVNAAGIAPSFPLVDFPLGAWRKTLEINLTGYFLMAREAARVLLRQGTGGAIVNLTSKSGLEASKANSAYNATKAGEVHLMRGWALELGSAGIRVNCVAPGNVFKGSKIWNDEYIRAAAKKKGIRPEEVIPYYTSLSALGREIEPEDIANAVVFLFSEEARNVTGQTLVVDGGQVMVR